MAGQPMESKELLQVWAQVLVSVQGKLGSQQAFETWFKPIVPRELSPQSVELEVPNAFFVDWIHQYHLPTLRESLAEILGESPEIRWMPQEPIAPAPVLPAELRLKESAREGAGIQAGNAGVARAWLDSQLNPRLTFGGFVVGSSNRFTHAGCLAVAANPGTVYNPLFIFGGSGLGKTHLLHAVGHAAKETRPRLCVYYVSAERFTNEMIYAIQHGQTLAFRNKYRNVDVLLIDDIQFLAGKESTQEEFFYTVLLLIADRIRSNIRDLEGCLVRLLAVASLTHQVVTLEIAEEVLQHYVNPEPDRMTPERILLTVGERFCVSGEALCGKRRTRTIALPRQVAMYLTRQLTDLSLVEIGRLFGGRDHTTVLYACDKVGTMIGADSEFADKINGLISTLAAG